MFKKFKVLSNKKTLKCSFCNRSTDEVEKLIANPSDRPGRAYICDECVAACNSMLESEKEITPK